MNRKKGILLLIILSFVIWVWNFILANKNDIDSTLIKGENTNLIVENNQFSINLFKKIIQQDGTENVIISPLSVSTSLAMIYNGAQGRTKTAIANTLGFDNLKLKEINQQYLQLESQLLNVNSKIKLNSVNSIWTDIDFIPQIQFKETIERFYQGALCPLDFDQPEAVNKINEWIAKQTNNQIKNMINNLQGTKMCLVNAIYFKGNWKQKFSIRETKKSKFKLLNNKIEEVMMMRQQGKFDYYQGDYYKLLKLPYDKSQLAMYILLPNQEVEFSSFLNNLNYQKLNQYMNSLSAAEVKVKLPKFKLQYGKKQLNSILGEMGLGIIFSNQADFSGIAPNLFIGSINHKAVIEVDEQGSEASGTTNVKMPTAMPPSAISSFYVNRPFLFLIKDNQTGVILFMGQVINPRLLNK